MVSLPKILSSAPLSTHTLATLLVVTKVDFANVGVQLCLDQLLDICVEHEKFGPPHKEKPLWVVRVFDPPCRQLQ